MIIRFDLLPMSWSAAAGFSPASPGGAKAKLFAHIAVKAAEGFGFSLETGGFSRLTEWVDANLAPRG